MLETPFDLIRCSWPRPVEQSGGRWVSEPDWNAPLMPTPPQPQWQNVYGELCWTIDWCDWFRRGLNLLYPSMSGEMPGFHVVFELRVNGSGKLGFWADDGCIIRRGEEILHSDTTVHALTRSELDVRAGDHLIIAQWQQYGEWVWGAHLTSAPDLFAASEELLRPYLRQIRPLLQKPTGPPLKVYSHGNAAIRTVVSLYSMILNGYTPSQVYLYGEHQWSEPSRQIFEALLPFARFVPTEEVLDRIAALGQRQLVDLACGHWYVMKACVSLCCPPHEFCGMDDDVFILDPVDDALSVFRQANLVFTPDIDHSAEYLRLWGEICGVAEPLGTGTLNAGLYWLRNGQDLRKLAADAIRVAPDGMQPYQWEQGLMACEYAQGEIYRLPHQRYSFPILDGLPGGMLNYDYAGNPCGFASIHFAGVAEKPTNAAALVLARDILSRSTPCP